MRRRCVHPDHDLPDCWVAYAMGVIGLWDWCHECEEHLA